MMNEQTTWVIGSHVCVVSSRLRDFTEGGVTFTNTVVREGTWKVVASHRTAADILNRIAK